MLQLVEIWEGGHFGRVSCCDMLFDPSRKYALNESFFDEWSIEMAYVLGFWFADGSMRKEKSYRTIFTSADRSILLQIRKVFSSSHPIRKRKERTGTYTYDLMLCSKRLYMQLLNLGGRERKSLCMEFPNVLSIYLRDFIRGYFDGDGSVFFVTYVRTKDSRTTRELRSNFTSGSRQFLEQLMEKLSEELGLSIKTLGEYNDGSSLKLAYAMKDMDALLRYLYYPGFSIGLKRKADFVSKIPDYQVHIT